VPVVPLGIPGARILLEHHWPRSSTWRCMTCVVLLSP
jgi:hypothetical protein